MIQQVVVGTDGSPDARNAVHQAIYVARKTEASLKCVFIVDLRKTQLPYIYAGGSYEGAFERLYIPPDPAMRQFYEQLADDLDEFAEKHMSECRCLAEEAGVRFESVIKSGYPGIELCDESRSGGLLVVGRRGENAHYKRSIVGSIAEDLIYKSPRPMLICPVFRETVSRILFAYDGSRTSEHALQFYVNGLKTLGDDLLIVLVGECPAEDHRLEEELNYLESHGVRYRVATRSGVASDEILKIAETESADLVVLGAQGKHRFKDYILGSTASHIVHKSRIPVLLVF